MSASQLKEILAGFKVQLDNTIKDEIRVVRFQSYGTGEIFQNGMAGSNIWRQDQSRNEERDRHFEWTRTLQQPLAPRKIVVPTRPDSGPSRRVATQNDRPRVTEISDTGSIPVMEDEPLSPHSRRPTRTTMSHGDSGRRRASHVRRQDSIFDIQQGVAGLILDYTNPFWVDIMNSPKEPKAKPPAIDAYEGTSGHDVHLLAYRHNMYVQGTTEATWCKYFPTTLKGVASK